MVGHKMPAMEALKKNNPPKNKDVKVVPIHEYLEASRHVADKLIDFVVKHCDTPEDPREKLYYHVSAHSRDDVPRRASEILSIITSGIDPEGLKRLLALGLMAGAGHDIWQGAVYEKQGAPGSDDEKYGKVFRRRFSVKNESESAAGVIALMRKENEDSGKTMFTEEDMESVRGAIAATIADFVFEKKTVVQKNLKADSSPLTRALALADIGAAGMDGPEKYLKEGDALFLEEQMDMHALELGKLDDKAREYYRNRMLGWCRFQAVFAQGRKNEFERELGNLPEEAKEAIRGLFSHFDESIEAASGNAKRREALSFEDLYHDMGFMFLEEGGVPVVERKDI